MKALRVSDEYQRCPLPLRSTGTVAPGERLRVANHPMSGVFVLERFTIAHPERWKIEAFSIAKRSEPVLWPVDTEHTGVELMAWAPRLRPILPWEELALELTYIGLDPNGESFEGNAIGRLSRIVLED